MLARAGLSVLFMVLAPVVFAADGANVFPQLGHSNTVHAAVFSPDGRLLASASEDSTIIIWDVAAHRELRTFRAADSSIDSVAFSPDGRTLVSAGGDGVVRVWDVRAGAQIRALNGHTGRINSVAFSPDGDMFASAGDDHSVILWSLRKGAALRTLSGHRAAVRGVAFSPDGRTLATASADKSVGLWDVGGGSQIRSLAGHADQVSSVAFCPGGVLASASWDHTVKLWDWASGREVRTLIGASSQIWSVACSREGAVATAGYDQTVTRWDGNSGRALRTYHNHTQWVESVAFSPDGALLASASADETVVLYDLTHGDTQATLRGSASVVKAIALSPDGHTIAAASTDRAIRLWNTADGRLRQILPGLPGWMDCLVYSPDGQLLVAGGEDRGLRVWDMRNGKPLYAVAEGHFVSGGTSIAFSPDGHVLAAATADRRIKLWEAASGQELRAFGAQPAAIESVAFSPDGRTLASADEKGAIKLWDSGTGTQIRTLSGHVGWIGSVAFSPDGRQLASGGADKGVRLWDVATGNVLKTFAGHTAAVDTVAFAPNGRQLASASWDHTIRIWDLAGSSGPRVFDSHSDLVDSIAFAKSRNLLVSASLDATIRLWDVDAGTELARLIAFNDGSSLGITPQGYYDYRGDRAEDHLNVRTNDQVSDISAYRETFFRPDLLRLSLGQQKLPDTLDTIDRVKPPPAVSLINVPAETDAETLNLMVRLNDRGGGVGDVRAFVNGTAVDQVPARDLGIKMVEGYQTRILPIRLVAGNNDIEVYAFNADRSVHSDSVHAVVMAKYAMQGKPKLYALVVGIEKYANSRFNLQYSVADATAVGAELKTKASPLFQSVNVEELTTPEQTTRTALIAALDRYRDLVGPNDIFVFYVASHGVVGGDVKTRQYYLVPSNWASTNEADLPRDAVGASDLKEMIGKIPAAKKLILLDTCNSGALGEALATTSVDANIISTAVGITVLSASSSDETAAEGLEGHGVFTWVLLQGMDGKADIAKTGSVNTTDLGGYVEREVPKIAMDKFQHIQNADVEKHGKPFQIVSLQ